MHCPYCSTEDTKVIDSRLANDGGEVRRRRECLNCHERFTTYERIELPFPSVKKNDGSLVDFSEAKLRTGIMRALEKRPVEIDDIDAAVTRILNKVLASNDHEVASKEIGEWVIEELALIDDVAYVRFASVYRRFQDLDAFQRELDLLKRKRKNNKPSISIVNNSKRS
ncbi:MAG: transcriptional regulator NrdR [Arenicellales bacterium]|jgi:transcriptional repressor NrdR